MMSQKYIYPSLFQEEEPQESVPGDKKEYDLTNLFERLAKSDFRSRFHLSIAPIGIGVPTFTHQGIPVSHQAFFAQADVIRELAAEGPCVIVGRCSDYILGEDPACIKVFIHADMASRIDRCVAEYHIPSDNMESRIIQMDRGRANYYNYYTGHTWGEMRRYDLTLNSSITGINGAVEMIAQLVRLRSAQLDQAPTQAP